MATIAIMTRDFSGSGIDRIIGYQANALVQDGNKVVIVTLVGDLSPPRGTEMLRLSRSFGFIGDRILYLTLPLNFRIVKEYLPEIRKFDILIAHTYPLTWVANMAKRSGNAKYVLYNHGVQNASLAGRDLVRRGYLGLNSLLYIATLGKPDEAISISRYAHIQLKSAAGLESKIIYNPVDLNSFCPALDPSIIRKKHALGAAPVILFAGRIEPNKGIHLLIQAHRLVRKAIPNAKLLIVGEKRYGNYTRQIESYLDDSVRLVGWVRSEELPYYFASCNVYASASLWEGFNLPLVEAQATGKPVVAFDIPAHREVIENNRTGFLIPLGDVSRFADVLTRLLLDEDSCARMGQIGRQLACQRFNLQRFSAETRSLVRALT